MGFFAEINSITNICDQSIYFLCVLKYIVKCIYYILISCQISCNRMNNFVTKINILSVIFFFFYSFNVFFLI